MASSFPPSCSRVTRSCSSCFCVLSSFARFSMVRFSHQREKRIPPTTNTTTTRAAEMYSVGFLKKGLDCISGSAGMVTPRMKQLPLKKYRETEFERNILVRVPFERNSCAQARSNSLLGGARDLAPSDQLDVLHGEQLAKFLAGKEIKVALAPGRAPSVALARSGFQFIVGEAEVDDEFGHAGLQIFEGSLVEVGPLIRCDAGRDRNCMVDYDIGGAQTFFQVGAFGEPVAGNENRKLVIVSDSNDDIEQILAVIEKTVLMRIQMRGTDAHRVGTVNLGAKFQIDFLWVDAGCWFPVVMEITVFIHEAWDFVFRSDRSPAVVDAFAGEREMQTKISLGM